MVTSVSRTRSTRGTMSTSAPFLEGGQSTAPIWRGALKQHLERHRRVTWKNGSVLGSPRGGGTLPESCNDACCPPSLQTDHPIRATYQTTCQQTRKDEKVISSPRGYGDPGMHVFNGGRASMESCMDGERRSSRAMGRSTWSSGTLIVNDRGVDPASPSA